MRKKIPYDRAVSYEEAKNLLAKRFACDIIKSAFIKSDGGTGPVKSGNRENRCQILRREPKDEGAF